MNKRIAKKMLSNNLNYTLTQRNIALLKIIKTKTKHNLKNSIKSLTNKLINNLNSNDINVFHIPSENMFLIKSNEK